VAVPASGRTLVRSARRRPRAAPKPGAESGLHTGRLLAPLFLTSKDFPMIRNSLILVASFGLLAGCAGSNASTQSPDAGNVKYDVGQPGTAGSDAATPDANDGGAAPAAAPKGRDSTTTKPVGVTPKAVKKIASSKPPKPEPAPTDPKAKPIRKGRTPDPTGMLAEAFTIEAAATKLPDLSTLLPTALFIARGIDASATTPLAGAPATVKAPIALRFTGSLNVTAANEYQLCTNSSDGSQLLIEDTLVVDNDGVNAEAKQVCELVNLEPGEYKLEVRSFHVTGPVLISASWAVGKDGTPAAIPVGNLFKPADADARVKAKK
jgi:hypothetical protein